ncbi:uncharacterized protein LOC123215098 [Mangifera indica]|uniref:uncharacterized protein LOC123215098 n=1 Tax=Mangifera indica TaxID=29780 RepID=UPI001CFA76A6|nr:uncharacterized protein LOC123215098 [Mangifera indica]
MTDDSITCGSYTREPHASRTLSLRRRLSGASNAMLETVVPYSRMSIIQSLGKGIANACKIPATFVSWLTESEKVTEFEEFFSEEQEIELFAFGFIPFQMVCFSLNKVNLKSA